MSSFIVGLEQHAPLISALASFGMLVIWSVYAWLFYGEFKRGRRCNLYIHPAGSPSVDSECLLVNLSQEPVHVLCSLAVRGRTMVSLYDRSEDRLPIEVRAKQGPLHAGQSLSLGAFTSICRQLDDAEREHDEDPEQIIEVRVAAVHGAHAQPVGAYRTFRWHAGRQRVEADSAVTKQVQSRNAADVRQWLTDCANLD